MFIPSFMGFDKAGFGDPDALAFFARVTAAGGSLSATEKTAVTTLVTDLKGYGIWSAMKAIYPMVGASAAACAQNLKSSSFTGTFSSGWTFASTGVTPNGTSAFFNSNFNPTGNFSLTSLAFGGYTSTATQKDGGYNGSLSPNFLHSWYGYGLAESFISSSIGTSGGVLGMMQNNLQGGTHKLYKNNTTAASSLLVITSIPNQNMFVGACNNGGAGQFFDNHLVSYYYYADGLTDAQASDHYTAVQAFQTTIGRQV